MRRAARLVARTVGPLAIAAAFATLLAWALPLTYDEAHNWTTYARPGIGYITHNYPAPNNQPLFSLLQSVLPASWVAHDPLALRLLNIGVALALIGLMYSWLARAGVPRAFALGGLLLSGPLTVLYLGVARGYLLGTLLVFLGLHLLASRRSIAAALASGVLFALAVYTIPTFAYGMVGIVLLLLWQRRIRDLLGWGVTATAIALALYQPIMRQVFEQTSRPFKHLPTQAPGAYALGTLRESLYLTAFGSNALWLAVLAAVAVALTIYAAYRYFSRPSPFLLGGPPGRPWSIKALRIHLVPASTPGATTVFRFVAAYAIGNLAVIEILHILGHLDEPYYRNSLFFGYAVVLLLLVALRHRGWIRWAAAAVVTANLLVGAVGVSLLATGLDYSPARYGNILVTTAPRALRDAASLGAKTVRCSTFDEPACSLYTDYLARRGVRVTTTYWTTDWHRCLIGHRPPLYEEGVLLLRRGRELGLLCGR